MPRVLPTPVVTVLALAPLVLAACAGAKKAPESKEPEQPATTSQVAELRTQVTQLQNKIDQLEGKLAAYGSRSETNAAAGTPGPVIKAPAPKATAVYPSPTRGAGSAVSASTSPADPETGFINDDSVELFRKSLLLLQTQKYSEAILSFASFLEQYPDHPLAGSAQFHIGESYFREKEYKLALHEFRRVLTSYDRSPHVSDTLQMMVACEEALNMPQEAAKHRQQLLSLFPQSPAAAAPVQAPGPGPSAAPGAPAEGAAPAPTGETQSMRHSVIDPIPTGQSAVLAEDHPPTAPLAGAVAETNGKQK